ncbi:glycosyltransferase family 2 protein [Aliiroseovarius sp. S1339]|uniref:glycosyltransferase family A protein n=1 Tax=Aliiroseovarius sp. S1339 TaxID=2936990 RepID=UPI0020BEAA94|nr:glycosyltransferase family 2 protein [Aliiroseovarius sp. S1339]MCK8463995.1 glycosyltransferase family 2 protein [Aliiroseovarius sp. S1339]
MTKSNLRQFVSGENSVSINIPVKNGLPHFKDVCEMLAQQDYDFPFEVVCVDSGSTDGSDALAEASGFRVVRIDPKDFGHGKTRNYAASLSKADYLVFITHDAIPNDKDWLSTLIAPMRADPKVAGVFSRHVAHSDADPFVTWELEQHFLGLSDFPVVEIADREEYDANEGLQQIYHFYSDNASAMPRRVWKQHPYPNVQFAEDQIWAKEIVEAGYRKAFAEGSVVRHSHSFGPFETLQRSFDESRAFRKLFGYRLGKSPIHVLKSAAYLAKRDLGLAVRNGWWKSHPKKTVSRLFEAFARPLGHYLGSRDSLPDFITRHLSRDDWIRNL